MKTRLGLVLCGWGAFGLATLACGDEAAPGDDSSTGGSGTGGSATGGSAAGGSATQHSGGAGGQATGGGGEGGAAECKALPSCPADQVEVDSCPPSGACSAQTLCGSTILCWSTTSTGWSLPPVDAPFDYQIGGAYEPPPGVQVVSRDRESPSAAGLFNICYVNGFQTQPQDNDDWLRDHPELLVPGADGEPLLDEDWGEYLFDVSTQEKRAQLLTIVAPWIEGCADDGFDAVEVDNLDSYSRSGGYLTKQDAVEFQAELSALAHSLGLSVGQKNSAELLDSIDAMGTDFAIAEECNRYDECGEFQDAYQDRVFVIEYRQQDFEAGCSDFPELSIVLRDLNVSAPGASSYVYDGC